MVLNHIIYIHIIAISTFFTSITIVKRSSMCKNARLRYEKRLPEGTNIILSLVKIESVPMKSILSSVKIKFVAKHKGITQCIPLIT